MLVKCGRLRLPRINKGRAYDATTERLGGFIFADYIRNKRRTV